MLFPQSVVRVRTFDISVGVLILCRTCAVPLYLIFLQPLYFNQDSSCGGPAVAEQSTFEDGQRRGVVSVLKYGQHHVASPSVLYGPVARKVLGKDQDSRQAGVAAS